MTLDLSNTYWGSTGKHQELADKLTALVPRSGEVSNLQSNPMLEKFRLATNCYYDLYNNGLGNRDDEFESVFALYADDYKNDFDTEKVRALEDIVDKIILDAAKEQSLLKVAEDLKALEEWGSLGTVSAVQDLGDVCLAGNGAQNGKCGEPDCVCCNPNPVRSDDELLAAIEAITGEDANDEDDETVHDLTPVGSKYDPYAVPETRVEQIVIHELRIYSLHDAHATCSCGGWVFYRTGTATREELIADYQSHSDRFRAVAGR